MKKFFALSIATAVLMTAPVFAAELRDVPVLPGQEGQVAGRVAKPGLEALPLKNKLIVFNDSKPVFEDGRMVALTVQTPTAAGAAVNYYRSILLSEGWKPEGVAASFGMVMTKDGQRLMLRTGINRSGGSGGATILQFTLTDDIPQK